MKIKSILAVIFVSILCTQNLLAQAPNWSISPNQYQYSMTVTAVLELNCNELSNPSNQLGAFVNDSLRGVSNTATVINGRYQASMLVYSSQVNGEDVTFKFYDQSTNKIYTSVDSVAFQDNAIYGNPSAPLKIRNNHQPLQLTLSYDTLKENQAIGATIGLLSSQDADVSQSHSYSLVSGQGDMDNSRFVIAGDTLKSNVVADYDQRTSYSIRLATTDNLGCSLEERFAIQVKNVNDPPSTINLSSNLVNENNAVNDVVAYLSAIDNDPNESFSYQLVNGSGDDDNGSFNIVNNELRANQVFDYESQDTFHLRLGVTDGAANSYHQSVMIFVIDLNETPTNLDLSVDSIAENQSVNTIIGMLSTTDEDANQSFTYSFDPVAGNDNALFNIVGSSLRTKSVFDYESRSSYIIYIQTRDQGGLTYSKQFTITIKDTNDLPTAIQLSNNTVNENQTVGTFIGRFTASDEDANASFSYSLVNGVGDSDNGNFQVSNDSLLSNQTYSFNSKPNHSIRVQATDNGGGSYSESFSIQINDINNAPADLYLSNPIILENTSRGSVVGSFSSQDPDQNDSHTYSLVQGTGDADNGSFQISNGNLLTDTTFNVNVQSSFSIRVRTTDLQNLSYEKVLILTITNSNDAPTNITLLPDSIQENKAVNSLIGQLSSVDPDLNDTHTYSFVNLSANDNGSFAIVGTELRSTSSFDYETKAAYVVQIQSDDGNGGVYAKQLFVSIKDTNDVPTDINLSANQTDEKQTADQFVGELSTVDQDAIDNFSYSLVSGNGDADNGDFRISNDSLYATGTFDVLVKSQLSIRIQTSDKDNKLFAKVFNIDVQDVNDAPTSINLSNASVPENTVLNTNVGFLNTSDIDPNQSFNYTLVAGTGDTDNGNFIVSANELKTNSLFDFNAQRTHRIRLRSTDQGGLSVEQVFTINITNTNDAPTDIILTPNSFNENIPQETTISALSTLDADSSDRFSYSFVNQGTNDNASFIIAGDELRTAAQFDFESKNLYVIEVQSRDQAGATYSRQLTLNVLDTNDAPLAVNISSDTLAERALIGAYVADISTQDVDANDNHTYSLVAGQGSKDNALFRINGNLLEVDSTMDYNDAKKRYIRLQSTDAGGKSIQNSFVIKIKNINDAPTDIILSDSLVSELVSVGSEVAALATIDEDANDQFTYSLVTGAGSSDNKEFDVSGNSLITSKMLDYEAKSTYNIRLRSTDAAGDYVEKAFSIYVENGNEAPEILDQYFSLKENSNSGTVLGALSASDSDVNDSLTFRIIDAINGFVIDAEGNLISNRKFDYENEPSVSFNVEVSDQAGAADTATIYVEILDQVEGALPTAAYLSPNGDGRNDYWEIKNVHLYSNYSLQIFSANGELVYEKPSNYNNDWDGTMHGAQLSDGIYYYVMIDTQDSSSIFKGTITLKR